MMAHVWIEHTTEYKLILRLTEDEASNLRKALIGASNHLVLSPEQHMICSTLASALEEPECLTR